VDPARRWHPERMTTGGTLAVIVPVLVAMLGATLGSMTIVVHVIGSRIDHFERSVDARFEQADRAIGTRFDAVGTRFDAVGTRFDDLGVRIDRVESRMGRLETRQDETLERLGSLDVRLKVLEQRPG